jgi:outer membrane protein
MSGMKNITIYLYVCILIHVLLPPSGASAQARLTLKQAINNALQNRKNIRAGKSDLAIAKLKTEALQRKYWPQLSFEYEYLYNPVLQTSILPIGIFNPAYTADATKSIQFGTKWSQTAGLSLYQPLFDYRIRTQTNELRLKEQISAAMQSQTEYQLVYNVAQAYINVCLQQEQIKSAVADTARTWISLQLQRNKYNEKRLLKPDLNKALINHNNALQLLNDAENKLKEAAVQLQFLTGASDLNKPDFITEDSLFINYIITTSPDKSLPENIPEIKQLQLQKQLPQIQEQSEKAKFLPTLGVKGFLGANQYSNNFEPAAPGTWFGLSYVGINFKAPILFGEDKQRELRQLDLQANQFNLQQEDLTAQYARDVKIAELNIQRIKSQLKTQAENLLISRESIQILRDRVAEGQETASTLNTEEASLQRIEEEYETGKSQLWLYWLDYLNASGRLDQLWK